MEGPLSKFLSDFSSVSAAAWKEKMKADLKGQPLSSIQWQATPHIVMDPGFHADDNVKPLPLSQSHWPVDWRIGEMIRSSSPDEANKKALTALAGGADAIFWDLPAHALEWDIMLVDVFPSFVEHTIRVEPTINDYQRVIGQVQKLQGAEEAFVSFSLSVDPFEFGENMPAFFSQVSSLGLQGPQRAFCIRTKGINDPSQEVSTLLSKGAEALMQCSALNIPIDQALSLLFFQVQIGPVFYLELAKLRALRYLWGLVCEAFKATNAGQIFIEAHTALNEQNQNVEQQMIAAPIQVMAAVFGGANRIFVSTPESEKPKDKDFYQRIARNVQHILKMESYLNKVSDPAAGSYYLEKLSMEIAQQAWAGFLQVESQGGFLDREQNPSEN